MAKQPDLNALERGFTLVELAMVIAVIGLLVGGLMGFRNYMRNAELMTMMNQAKFYIDAYNKFQTKYNAPPGDYCSPGSTCGTQAATTASGTWSGAYNGDGNGLIRAGATAFRKESYYSFQHLALGGFIPGNYSGIANGAWESGGATIGWNVPGTTITNAAFLFDHPSETDGVVSGGAGGGDAVFFDGMYGNLLRIAAVSGGPYNTIPNLPMLTGKQSYQIDSKFDDGQPGTGNIVAPINTALANCATTNVTTTAAYNTTASDDKVCYIFLKIQ